LTWSSGDITWSRDATTFGVFYWRQVKNFDVLLNSAAPVGSVLVYGANRAAGHVEIRTKDGFVSDFNSKTPSHRPLLGVYAKL